MALAVMYHRINMPIYQMNDPLGVLGHHLVVRYDHYGGA